MGMKVKEAVMKITLMNLNHIKLSYYEIYAYNGCVAYSMHWDNARKH